MEAQNIHIANLTTTAKDNILPMNKKITFKFNSESTLWFLGCKFFKTSVLQKQGRAKVD